MQTYVFQCVARATRKVGVSVHIVLVGPSIGTVAKKTWDPKVGGTCYRVYANAPRGQERGAFSGLDSPHTSHALTHSLKKEYKRNKGCEASRLAVL